MYLARLVIVDEDVGRAVCIVHHQVAGPRDESDPLPIGGDAGSHAVSVAGGAALRQTDELRGAVCAIVQEDAPGVGCLVVPYVADPRVEDHPQTVCREVQAVIAAPQPSTAHGPDPLRGSGFSIADEDVGAVVSGGRLAARLGIVGHEVSCEGPERYPAPVGRDGGCEAGSIALVAVGGDAHTLDGLGDPVIHEDVRQLVGILRHQRGGLGLEHYPATVGRDVGAMAGAVAFYAGWRWDDGVGWGGRCRG